MKKFLISIDTEGDNLWKWKKGDIITTENAKYLDRFQLLCEDYGFKPTYLTNYEMISNREFANWLKRKSLEGKCEVGMHLHAWSTPPYENLTSVSNFPAQPYLIEYSNEIMEEKVKVMTEALSNAVEQKIITHRSGRWAMDDRYFEVLAKMGYQVDCSVTPYIDWSNYSGESEGSKGADYSKKPATPYCVKTRFGDILEVPMTIRKTSKLFVNRWSFGSIISALKKSVKGQKIWLRPNGENLNQMLWLNNRVLKEKNCDYLMFMLHSSEFMPGGSPTFKTEESIENLYRILTALFCAISKDFEGCTIGNYGFEKITQQKFGE